MGHNVMLFFHTYRYMSEHRIRNSYRRGMQCTKPLTMCFLPANLPIKFLVVFRYMLTHVVRCRNAAGELPFKNVILHSLRTSLSSDFKSNKVSVDFTIFLQPYLKQTSSNRFGIYLIVGQVIHSTLFLNFRGSIRRRWRIQ
jgi:hypothetical protein